MRRWLALGIAVVLIGLAVLSWKVGEAQETEPLGAAVTAGTPVEQASEDRPLDAPEASEADREAKRLRRLDRDKDAQVSRDEFLRSRQRAFAKLDANGDGRVDFEEYAAKAAAKFKEADTDESGQLSAAELATTAVKRKAKPRASCPPERDEA